MRRVVIPVRPFMVWGIALVAAGCGRHDFASGRESRVLPDALEVRNVRVLLVDRQSHCRVRIDERS